MNIEREYGETVQGNYQLGDYPEVDDASVQFPAWMPIAYAVCAEVCGNRQWIVDGGPQICDKCGNFMFRTAVRWYKRMSPESEPSEAERSELYTVWRENNSDADV